MELRKPDLPYTLVNLLNEKIITEDDLNQFSSELQDAVKQLQERMETSLDKGTQRKTTENELPSLTQCTA